MTRRAAIIPGGWTAIVIAEDDGAPVLRPLLAESFEVGQLVEDELGQKRRAWSKEDVELMVRRVMQRLIDLKAETAVIEWATSKTSKAHALAQAIRLACFNHGIQCTYAKRWRLWNMEAHRAWVISRLAEGYQGWPSDTFTVSRDAGVMLLESIAPDRPKQFPIPIAKEQSHVPDLESIEEKSDAEVEAAPVTPGETAPKRRRTPAEPVALLPRTAGIDPGSGYLGLVITEGDTVPVQFIHKAVFPVGEKVALKRPRKIKRDGQTTTLTTRHSLTPKMAGALADKIVSRLTQYRVTKLAIEHVESVHINSKKHPSSASSIATSLVRSGWLDILIGERAEAAGIEVVRVGAPTWRARVAGRRKKGGAGAELIPEAVASRIRGWPPESDEHEHDAAGVCLWRVLPPLEAPALVREKKTGTNAAPRAPREPGRRPPSYYLRLQRERDATAQARAAAGCQCGNQRQGRHRTGCPLAC